MPLPQGTLLGPYEIDVPLGGGRQGDIYAARDTRLGRDVAIKVLSEDYSRSPDDLERFHREAKTLSALNHPHICVLYDIGREGEIDYLVMERVEGETLAQRLSRGRLPFPDVLRLGAQIADALDRAHRAGVVHRDLKPGNVMLTKSGVKLLDFGLASALRANRAARSTMTALPHLEDSVTAEGMVVGTVPYMAPEQLEGEAADGRVDIWALGCVLYEMATGQRPFEEETQAGLISAIMRGEPQAMSEVVPLAPPALERAVRQCLAKDPDDRWQTAGDLGRELVWIAESGSRTGIPATIVQARKARERVAWAVAVVAIVVAALTTVQAVRPTPAPKPLIFSVPPPPQSRPGAYGGGLYGLDVPRISPDGRHIAYNVEDSLGVRSLWVRHMASLQAERLPGTEGARRCFWSPDSRFLAFFSGQKLYKVDITGGSPAAICDAPYGDLGSWGSRDLIVFDSERGDSVRVVPASGGVPTGVDVIDHASGEVIAWPEFLPDGRHFLYISSTGSQLSETVALRVASIDSGEPKTVGTVGSGVAYGSGHLLYVIRGMLVARKFDTKGLKFVGEPFPVAEDVAKVRLADHLFKFSVSSEGTLVYRDGGNESQRLTWIDRRGMTVGTVGDAGRFAGVALSPDGTQVATAVLREQTGTREIWIWDLARNIGVPLTSRGIDASTPVWSPDGSTIAYSVKRGDFADVYLQPVVGGGEGVLAHQSNHRTYPSDWSLDGRTLLCTEVTDRPWGVNIFLMSLGDTNRAVPLLATAVDESRGMFSPDGTLLAYVSDESGAYEVYVSPILEPGRKQRVSSNGGGVARWRDDGKAIFYVTPSGEMMEVGVSLRPSLHVSAPRKLFELQSASLDESAAYDVTHDGQRFLVIANEGEPPSGHPYTVVVDWLGRLGKR